MTASRKLVDRVQVSSYKRDVTNTENPAIVPSIQRRAALRLAKGLIDQAEYDRQVALAPLPPAVPSREDFLAGMRGSGACLPS